VLSRSAALDAKSRALDARSRAQASAIRAAGRAQASALRAASRAQAATSQASIQFTPLAKSAQLTLGRGVYGARVWAAPRIERTGVAVQEQLAPRISSALTTTARRVQPRVVRSPRRWPLLVGGIALLAAGGAAAAVLRQRRSSVTAEPSEPAPTPMPGQAPASPELGETAQVDANGQVRTP
jgi:hypothetical protein